MSLKVGELARSAKEQASRRKSSRSIGARDPSLRWPHLYDLLRAKGYDKEKAARISNSRLRFRKKGKLEGLPYKKADSRAALNKVKREYEKKHSRTASALVAACYSAACRPPTSGGTGGSNPKGSASGRALSLASKAKAAGMRGGASSNTSVYPADTFKTVKHSDSHPKAPGADDRTAIRGHKGLLGKDPERRIPRAGETVDIYRDLGHGKEFKRGFPDGLAFSVRHASAMDGSKTGLVVASTTGVVLANGRPSWAHSAKAGAEVAGKRGVHGFIRGEVVEYKNPAKLEKEVRNNPEWKKITYYPGTQDFFDPVTRQRFVGSDRVALVNGEFFAKGPKFVTERAPVSPIEKRITAERAKTILANSGETISMESLGVTQATGRHRSVAESTRGDDTLWNKAPIERVSARARFIGTEETVKTRHVRKVVEGNEPLRQGYEPRLYRLSDGTLLIADGHTRTAMHNLLGSDEYEARVLPFPNE